MSDSACKGKNDGFTWKMPRAFFVRLSELNQAHHLWIRMSSALEAGIFTWLGGNSYINFLSKSPWIPHILHILGSFNQIFSWVRAWLWHSLRTQHEPTNLQRWNPICTASHHFQAFDFSLGLKIYNSNRWCWWYSIPDRWQKCVVSFSKDPVNINKKYNERKNLWPESTMVTSLQSEAIII